MGNVDNIMLAHSLRPHSMEGHMHMYKRLLHHTNNTIPKWKLELLGVFVSLLNRFEHYFEGMRNLLLKEKSATLSDGAAIDALYNAFVRYGDDSFDDLNGVHDVLQRLT